MFYHTTLKAHRPKRGLLGSVRRRLLGSAKRDDICITFVADGLGSLTVFDDNLGGILQPFDARTGVVRLSELEEQYALVSALGAGEFLKLTHDPQALAAFRSGLRAWVYKLAREQPRLQLKPERAMLLAPRYLQAEQETHPRVSRKGEAKR